MLGNLPEQNTICICIRHVLAFKRSIMQSPPVEEVVKLGAEPPEVHSVGI